MGKLASWRPALPSHRPDISCAGSESARTRGNTWMRIRDRIFTRDHGMCRCAECTALGRWLPAHEVDHILELADGGDDSDDNLQAINRDCHRRKSAAAAARRARSAIGAAPGPARIGPGARKL